MKDYNTMINEVDNLKINLIKLYNNEQNDISNELKINAESRTAGFVKRVHELWVSCAGNDGGRPRNSVRHLAEMLGDNSVRSLYPKLVGRTPAKKNDVKNLLIAMLSNWQIQSVDNKEETEIISFDINNISKLTDKIVDELYRDDETPIFIKENSSITKTQFVKKLFLNSDILYVISRSTTVEGFTPESINAFKDGMSQFLSYAQEGGRENKIHIWVLDAGNKELPHSDSMIEYINFSIFRSILSACALYDLDQNDNKKSIYELLSPKQAGGKIENSNNFKLWDNLIKHGVVIVKNLPNNDAFIKKMESEDGEKQDSNGFENIEEENILPTKIPEKWITENNIDQFKATGALKKAYKGSNKKNFTIIVSSKIDQKNIPIPKYYPISLNIEGRDFIDENNFFESPGKDYDAAMVLLYLAAQCRLFKKKDYSETIWYLRKMNFEVMRLNDFINHPLI